MIVKNEEDVLARCLKCVKQFADEIIIVDTGSSDHTVDIARQYTDNVYDFVWCDDFAKARNFSFSKAEMDYCMWMDADDVVPDEEIAKINALKQSLSEDVSIVMMQYHTGFDEQGNPTFTYYRERIVKRNEQHQWVGVIHEVIPLIGKLQYVDIAITHRKMKQGDGDRNLLIFEGLIAKGVRLDAREQFYYARELYYHKRYEDAFTAFRQFLDEGAGWLENNIDACAIMGYCAYEMGKDNVAIQCLLRSLEYDEPRAEICCDIGKHFFDRGAYKKALFWYETARTRVMDETSGAFVRRECYDYVPCLQLCVCWWRLGDMKKAKMYNELAGEIKDSEIVRKNRLYFEGV